MAFTNGKRAPQAKCPTGLHCKVGKPFAFAGLWDSWKDDEGHAIQSFTILTTSSNPLIESLHDRMPVIRKKEYEATWLDTTLMEVQKLDLLLQPYSAEEMKLYKVSPIVNSWKNDTPDCITPQ